MTSFARSIVPAFLRMVLSSIGLALVAGLIWGTVQLVATMTVKEDAGLIEAVGLTGLVMTFVAAGVAFLNGAILGAISSTDRLPRRLLWHAGVYLALAMAWSFTSVRANAKRDLRDLVSAGEYALFEKQIDGRLSEAWGAALIHADPEAMKYCIRHGADANTWARTDTSLFASRPVEPPVEIIVLHRYWSSLVPDQRQKVRESLRLLQENGADLRSACLESGRVTPMQYATDSQVPALVEALRELGVTP